jgi:hypothetical protein
MTKKHFTQLALIINAAHPYTQGSDQAERIVREIAGELAKLCRQENPRFDSTRFFQACGYPK